MEMWRNDIKPNFPLSWSLVPKKIVRMRNFSILTRCAHTLMLLSTCDFTNPKATGKTIFQDHDIFVICQPADTHPHPHPPHAHKLARAHTPLLLRAVVPHLVVKAVQTNMHLAFKMPAGVCLRSVCLPFLHGMADIRHHRC